MSRSSSGLGLFSASWKLSFGNFFGGSPMMVFMNPGSL